LHAKLSERMYTELRQQRNKSCACLSECATVNPLWCYCVMLHSTLRDMAATTPSRPPLPLQRHLSQLAVATGGGGGLAAQLEVPFQNKSHICSSSLYV
jgi:hypothetical protein